jgi:hypothetical protein
MRLSVPRRHGQFRIHQLTGDRLAAGGFAKDVYAGRTPLWLLSLSDGEPTEHSAHLGQLGSHIVGVANLWPILRLKHHNPKGGALKPNRFHPMPAVSATEVARLFSSVALQCLMTCRGSTEALGEI